MAGYDHNGNTDGRGGIHYADSGPWACYYAASRTGTRYGADAAICYARAGGRAGGYTASAPGTGLPGGGDSGPRFGGYAQYHGNRLAAAGRTGINAVSAHSGPRFGGGTFCIGNRLAAAVRPRTARIKGDSADRRKTGRGNNGNQTAHAGRLCNHH